MNGAQAFFLKYNGVRANDRGRWRCRGCGSAMPATAKPPYCSGCDPTGERTAADQERGAEFFAKGGRP